MEEAGSVVLKVGGEDAGAVPEVVALLRGREVSLGFCLLGGIGRSGRVCM